MSSLLTPMDRGIENALSTKVRDARDRMYRNQSIYAYFGKPPSIEVSEDEYMAIAMRTGQTQMYLGCKINALVDC